MNIVCNIHLYGLPRVVKFIETWSRPPGTVGAGFGELLLNEHRILDSAEDWLDKNMGIFNTFKLKIVKMVNFILCVFITTTFILNQLKTMQLTYHEWIYLWTKYHNLASVFFYNNSTTCLFGAGSFVLRVANYAIQWLWSWQVLCAKVQIQGLSGELNEPEITEWWTEEG